MKPNCYNKHWPRQNLAELLRFLDRMHPEGLSLKTVSEKIRHTQQYVSQTFMKDDMKLSKAEMIARCYGYSLRLMYPKKDPLLIDRSQHYRTFPNSGNLHGLVEYLNDSNISINHMSQRIGKANSVITEAFNKGDIMLSTLYEIIRNLGIEVYWYFDEYKIHEYEKQSDERQD